MPEDTFAFELYRLNIVDKIDLFTMTMPVIRDDNDIERLIRHATQPIFDQETPGGVSVYRWGLRAAARGGTESRPVLMVTLARSTLAQHGRVVTDDEIIEGVFGADPPLATTMTLFFDLQRHLVAAERTSQLMQSSTWRKVVEKAFDLASADLQIGSTLTIDPRPEENEVLSAFMAFERVTRLKVHLRLPNPEISRITRHLYDDLRKGGIREYVQDMRNPNGLSKDETALPYASAAMAQQGYKSKEVTLEGIQDGRYTKVVTGRNAARGSIQQLRDFVRGLSKTAKTQEGIRIAMAVTEEIDRIAPPAEGEA